MNEKIDSLVRQLLEIDPAERQEVFLALFGSGLLPETVQRQEAEAVAEEASVRYQVQGTYVDQRTYEIVQGVSGIFSAEQFGLNINDAADAYDALATARRAQANLRSVVGGNDWSYKHMVELREELRKVGKFLGIIDPKSPLVTPSAEQIVQAIGPRPVPQ
jgi:hypothetical protein